VDWIHLTKDRYRWRALVKSVMNLRAPQNAGNLPSGCTTCVLPSGTQLHRVSYIIGSRPRKLPVCNIASTITVPRAPVTNYIYKALNHFYAIVLD
jgi:hypothetical protein